MELRRAAAPIAIAAHCGGIGDTRTPITWRDAESELVVFPAETPVRIACGFVIVQLRVASDQTGVDLLVLPFRVGNTPNEAVATSVSESVPRSDATLAARWGDVATTITWHAILRAVPGGSGDGGYPRRAIARRTRDGQRGMAEGQWCAAVDLTSAFLCRRHCPDRSRSRDTGNLHASESPCA